MALFRGSHLSVLYKPPSRRKIAQPADTDALENQASSSSANPSEGLHSESSPSEPSSGVNDNVIAEEEEQDHTIYVLSTDHVFLHEPSVVWERLDDVDGSASSFVDSDFRRSTPAGGDWAGQTAEHVAAAIQRQNQVFPEFDPAE